MRTACVFGFALIFLFCFGEINAQTGINFKSGVSWLKFKDEMRFDRRLVHISHRYGFDAIVEERRFLFMPGFHYQRTALFGTDVDGPVKIFENRMNFHQLTIPINFGYRVTHSRWLKVRPYAGGYVSFIVEVDDNPASYSTDRLHGVNPGYQIGTQVGIYFLTLDLIYEKGLTNIIKDREQSRLSGFSIVLGLTL